MDIQFIATLAVIAPDPQQSRELFIDALGREERADALANRGVATLAEI